MLKVDGPYFLSCDQVRQDVHLEAQTTHPIEFAMGEYFEPEMIAPIATGRYVTLA
jgi:hypothetical protein